MGKKILILSVVAFLLVFWSSFIVGVDSSTVLRHKRQAAEAGDEDHPFGPPIDNERGTPSEPKDNAESKQPLPAASSGDNTTTGSTPAPAANTTVPGQTDKQDGTSTVTVTVVIVILVIAIVVVAGVFIYLRMRKKRMADYEKKTQIQMSSTSNAGVYIDLTSTPAGEKEKQPDSPETEHLNKEEE